MPDAESESVWRGGRLLTALFWSGVGLAPLAVLLLLVGSGGGASLRVGAVLALLAVMLIGLSVALRPDTTTVRLQLEETLLEEIDNLRDEVRQEIATASRASHQSFGERVGALQHQVEALRAERAAPPPVAAAASVAAPPPVAQAPVAQAPVAQGVAPTYGTATPYPPPAPAAPVSAPAGRHLPPPVSAPAANGRAAVGPPGGRRGGRWEERRGPEPSRRSTGRANVPVYRRTETVHVTRSTSYVDEPTSGAAPDPLYDSGFHRRFEDGGRRNGRHGRHDGDRYDADRYDADRYDERTGGASSRHDQYEESWTDRKLRERYGRRSYDPEDSPRWDTDGGADRDRGEDRWRPVSAEPVSSSPRRGRSERWQDEDSTGLRIGERWASVRDDERGRELTLGERRAARHRDGASTELRIEDRWAAVRQEANGRDRERGGRDGYALGEPDYGRPALPAASSEPSWNDSWDEPVRESRGRRYREDGDERGYGAPRQRRLDFELSDERWR